MFLEFVPVVEPVLARALPFVGRLLGTVARAALGDALYNFLFGGSTPNNDDLATAIDTVAQTVTWLTDTLDDVQRREQQAIASMLQQVILTGNDIADMGQRMYDAFQWTYSYMVPGSLQWLYDYMSLKLILPLQNRVTLIEFTDRQFRQHFARIDNWGRTFVNPTLHEWLTWYTWWKTWPRQSIELFHSWLQHPARFGEWATPPVAHALIPWLAHPAQKRLRDMLTAELLESTPDTIDAVVLSLGELLNTPVPDQLAA